MRSVLSRQLHWVALGVGILIIAVGVSVFVWPLQDSQGIGSVLRANDGMPNEGFGPTLTVANDVALSDSAALDAETAEPPRSHGGPGDVAKVQDRAHLVVRDAEGNIKYQDTVK